MSQEAWGDEGNMAPEGYILEETYVEDMAEKDAGECMAHVFELSVNGAEENV